MDTRLHVFPELLGLRNLGDLEEQFAVWDA